MTANDEDSGIDAAGNDLVLEEILAHDITRQDQGDPANPDEYLQRFPQFAASLRDFFASDEQLKQFGLSWDHPPRMRESMRRPSSLTRRTSRRGAHRCMAAGDASPGRD